MEEKRRPGEMELSSPANGSHVMDGKRDHHARDNDDDDDLKRPLQTPRRHRWLQATVLVLCSALAFGSNYCYHNPAALKNQLQQHFSDSVDKNEYEVLFNMLYTLYSTPNIVLPFVGGYLVDRVGPQQMLLLLTCFVLIGQSVMAFGCTVTSFRLMLIGRIIFGFGGESLGVARTTFISTWFEKKDLALALGISNSFSGLGGILNSVLSPYFADKFGVSFSLWFGAITCAVSLMATVALIPIDRVAQAASPLRLPNGQPRLEKSDSALKISDAKHFGAVFWFILLASISVWGSMIPFQTVAGSLLLERDFFRRPPQECRRCGEGSYASYTDCHEIVPSCPQSPPYAWPLPKLSASCEVTRAIDQMSCSVKPPFIADSEINCDSPVWKLGPATQLYCSKKIIAEEQASRVMSLPSIITLIASPLFGYIAGRMPNRGWMTVVATGLIVLTQFLIATTRVSIWLLLFIQGASSCLFFSSIWPSIPYVVEEHHVGTAYGAIIAAGNLVLAVLPMVVAGVFRVYGQYLPTVQLLLTAVGSIAFVSCCMLWGLERKHGRLLNPQTPHIQQARRVSITGSLWESTPATSPTSSEYDRLLRVLDRHRDYHTGSRAHDE